jgi:hypothetical protein
MKGPAQLPQGKSGEWSVCRHFPDCRLETDTAVRPEGTAWMPELTPRGPPPVPAQQSQEEKRRIKKREAAARSREKKKREE